MSIFNKPPLHSPGIGDYRKQNVAPEKDQGMEWDKKGHIFKS